MTSDIDDRHFSLSFKQKSKFHFKNNFSLLEVVSLSKGSIALPMTCFAKISECAIMEPRENNKDKALLLYELKII